MVKISGFSDEIDDSLETQLQVLCALGQKYLSLRDANGKNIGRYTVPEFRTELWGPISGRGLRLSSLGSLIGKIPVGDSAAFQEQLKTLETLCRMCEIADCRYIRVFSFFLPPGQLPELYLEQVAEKLSLFAETARRYGVTLLHENEKNIYGSTALRCKTVLDLVGSPSLKCLFDPGGFVRCGQDVWNAWELLQGDAVYFHIKDTLYQTRQNVLCGTGDAAIEAVLRSAVRERGFDGFLTLEPHLVLFRGMSAQELERADTIIEKNRAQDKISGYKMQYHALQNMLRRIGADQKQEDDLYAKN